MKFHHIFRNWRDTCEVGAGEVIFAEGDPADAMYYILSGEVELKLGGEPFAVEGAGGMIGETALLGVASRSGTATARTDVKLARVDREQLKELMGNDTDFALHVMAGFANRLRAVDAYISTHLGRKAKDRS
jgi:CRP-like cAMP-binding protein